LCDKVPPVLRNNEFDRRFNFLAIKRQLLLLSVLTFLLCNNVHALHWRMYLYVCRPSFPLWVTKNITGDIREQKRRTWQRQSCFLELLQLCMLLSGMEIASDKKKNCKTQRDPPKYKVPNTYILHRFKEYLFRTLLISGILRSCNLNGHIREITEMKANICNLE